jgi:hypothetical protein
MFAVSAEDVEDSVRALAAAGVSTWVVGAVEPASRVAVRLRRMV